MRPRSLLVRFSPSLLSAPISRLLTDSNWSLLLYADKKVLVVGVPGAFTPVCSSKHVRSPAPSPSRFQPSWPPQFCTIWPLLSSSRFPNAAQWTC